METLEPWVDWIKRVTSEVEEVAFAVGGLEQRRWKWTWAGHVARRLDGRWTNSLLHWMPEGTRKQARPCKRWSDQITSFWDAVAGKKTSGVATWAEVAQSREHWQELEEEYLAFCAK